MTLELRRGAGEWKGKIEVEFLPSSPPSFIRAYRTTQISIQRNIRVLSWPIQPLDRRSYSALNASAGCNEIHSPRYHIIDIRNEEQSCLALRKYFVIQQRKRISSFFSIKYDAKVRNVGAISNFDFHKLLINNEYLI